MQDLKLALGKYELYKSYLKVLMPERKIFIAVDTDIFKDFFLKKAVQFIIEEKNLPLIVVDLLKEEITEWIN